MRRYNINVKALIMVVLIFIMAVVLLISLFQAVFRDRGSGTEKIDTSAAVVSATPPPTVKPTHTPRPSATPVSTDKPTEAPPSEPVSTPQPTPDAQSAQEIINAFCFEPPEEHSPDEAMARLQILASCDSRFQNVIDRLPELPEMSLLELSVNPELLDFLLNWPGQQAEGYFTSEELGSAEGLLMQYDPRWGYASYGSGPVAFNGCGPTCLSMAVLHFTGNQNATPDRVASWALKNDYYVTGSGTKWTMFSEGIREWGVGSKELPLWKGSILDELDKGNWIVMCMKKGNFTIFGHFIVVCGYEEGGFRVLDPFSRARSSILWPYEDIEDQISNLWAVGISDELMSAG